MNVWLEDIIMVHKTVPADNSLLHEQVLSLHDTYQFLKKQSLKMANMFKKSLKQNRNILDAKPYIKEQKISPAHALPNAEPLRPSLLCAGWWQSMRRPN